MKKLSFNYHSGEEFYLFVDSEYLKCVILEEEGFNFSKGIKEYRVQLEDKKIIIVKEKDLIHPQHYKDLMFDQENTDFIDI